MRFWTRLPGLSRWPTEAFSGPEENWQVGLGTADFQQIARRCDELGYDSITVPEHLAMPTELVPSLGAHWPDALTVMSFLAGATTRIRVNSGVIVLPLHHPVRLAKAVATLDQLSGGRVMLTFGVGMAAGEFAALGVDFRQRGRITDEYVAALKTLWTADPARFHGEFVEFDDVVLQPRPVQHPHPPIFFGGRSMAALRRAARLGDGWTPSGAQGGKGPWVNGPADLPAFLAQARREEGFTEREASFEIAMEAQPTIIDRHHRASGSAGAPTSTQQVIDLVAQLQDAGVSWTYVAPLGAGPQSLAGYLEYLEWAATEVMPHFGH